MAQSYAEFGDLDIQQSGGQEEAEFGALEIQQAQVLFSALNALRQGQPPSAWESEAAAEIEVQVRSYEPTVCRQQYTRLKPNNVFCALAGHQRPNFSSSYCY